MYPHKFTIEKLSGKYIVLRWVISDDLPKATDCQPTLEKAVEYCDKYVPGHWSFGDSVPVTEVREMVLKAAMPKTIVVTIGR